MNDRISALNWVYENHRLQVKSLCRLNASADPEMEKWLKEEIKTHQEAMDRVEKEILNIAYPDTGDKEAQPKKFPSHRPQGPENVLVRGDGQINPKAEIKKKISDIDPKQYY